MANTLHFINRIDSSNAGDWNCCPLQYYWDYFSQFNIRRHDIRYINYSAIDKDDVVIFGGGGLFDYAEFTNRNINRVLDIGAKCICWSSGLNSHSEFEQTFESEIKWDKFIICTLRDFNNSKNIEYLSDVTCKHPAFDEKYSVKRKIGIATHKDYQIKNFTFDSITNDKSIEEIIRFIGESEIIISNSFHMIYWAQLLGKKVICYAPFASRFFSYKYKPQYLNSVEDLDDAIEKCDIQNFLDEARKENNDFFEKIKIICDESLQKSTLVKSFDQLALEGLLYSCEKEKSVQKENGFVSNLFFDAGDGFKIEQTICCINNVFEDKVHKVRFNLEKIDNIKALRFDPLEGLFCKIKILSVKSDNNDFKLNSVCCQNNTDGFDLFYTTDPQYYGLVEGNINFLEIEFALEIADGFEVQCAVYGLNDNKNELVKINQKVNSDIGYLNEQNTMKSKLIDDLNGKCEWYANTLKEKDNAINQMNSDISRLNEEITSIYNSKSWKITKPLRKIMKLLRREK